MQEVEIKDKSKLPKYLYHLIPQKLFYEFVKENGEYDCINKEEWGKNSPFIHTSPTKKQLKERVADMNWSNYPLERKFVLLEIETSKIKSKITYSEMNGYIYHHIWGSLPKDSYTITDVLRSDDGKFLI